MILLTIIQNFIVGHTWDQKLQAFKEMWIYEIFEKKLMSLGVSLLSNFAWGLFRELWIFVHKDDKGFVFYQDQIEVFILPRA